MKEYELFEKDSKLWSDMQFIPPQITLLVLCIIIVIVMMFLAKCFLVSIIGIFLLFVNFLLVWRCHPIQLYKRFKSVENDCNDDKVPWWKMKRFGWHK